MLDRQRAEIKLGLLVEAMNAYYEANTAEID